MSTTNWYQHFSVTWVISDSILKSRMSYCSCYDCRHARSPLSYRPDWKSSCLGSRLINCSWTPHRKIGDIFSMRIIFASPLLQKIASISIMIWWEMTAIEWMNSSPWKGCLVYVTLTVHLSTSTPLFVTPNVGHTSHREKPGRDEVLKLKEKKFSVFSILFSNFHRNH
jgi:hypothetical protein